MRRPIRRARAKRSFLTEVALGEGSDERDLDEEATHRLQGGEGGEGIAQALERLEEASAVEAADTEDQRLVPWEWRLLGGSRQAKGYPAVGRLQEEEGEAREGDQVPEERAHRSVPIASEQEKHPGEEPRTDAAREAMSVHLALQDLSAVGEAISLLGHALAAHDSGELEMGTCSCLQGPATGSAIYPCPILIFLGLRLHLIAKHMDGFPVDNGKVSAVEADLIERGAVEGGVVELRVLVHRRVAEIGVLQVCPAEVGPVQLRSEQAGSLKVCPKQIGSLKVCPKQIGSL